MADLFVTPPRTDDMQDRWRQRISELLNQSAYGGYQKTPTPLKNATSVAVPTGTITSGDVTSTFFKDQVYLTVQEADGGGGNEKFDIQFSFTGLVNQPETMDFLGYYEGNPGHNVFLYIYDFVGAGWDRVTGASTDFPSASAEYQLSFALPTDTKYISSGEVRLRIYHDSAPSSAHFMYIDNIDVTEPTYYITVPGAYTDFTNVTAYPNKGITIDAALGTATIIQTGNYEVTVTTCFSGDAAHYELGLFVNGTKVKDMWDRDISVAGDVGSAAGRYNAKFDAGDVLKAAFTADSTGAHITIFDATMNIRQNQI